MDEEERIAMEFIIASAPDDHPVIPGAGGFRKARWARLGQGNVLPPGKVNMAAIYAKSRQANLSSAEQNALSGLAKAIKKEART